ncbi:MAG TPA: hypothetical protein VG412_01685, partial [Acidimicrobiales bacterium]|nr:hypothetical protein [Acidimicrobiales bacterium]
MSATDKTLASTTITIVADGLRCLDERDTAHGPRLGSCGDFRPFPGSGQHFIHGRRTCLFDQLAPQVLLERLMGFRRPATKDGVGLFRNVFDLHAGHGAIMALLGPNCKSQVPTGAFA